MARLYLENDSIPLDVDSITTGDWIKSASPPMVMGKVVNRGSLKGVKGMGDGFLITVYFPRHEKQTFIPIDDVYILGIQGGGR